jgi:uncharacterized protein (TIGR03437 family)
MLMAIVLAMVLGWTSALEAQTPAPGGVNVVVQMTHREATFAVDGRLFQGSASFLWPQGTKHVLDFPLTEADGYPAGYQYTYNGFEIRTFVRFAFGAWTTNQTGFTPSANRSFTVTADASLNRITGAVSPEYLVRLRLFEAGSVLPAPDAYCTSTASERYFSPGIVTMGTLCYNQNVDVWQKEGPLNVAATPYPGYVFLGWKTDGTVLDGYSSGSFNLTGPMTVVARFTSAKRVNFRTEPAGLKVRIDRAEVRTTEIEPCEPNNYLVPGAPKTVRPPCIGEFDFAPGSKHIIAGVSPQLDRFGKAWVLDKFTTGQTGEWIYTTPSEIFPEERIVAQYVRGITLSFQTQPAGLKLKIDGRDNWPENYFIAAAGTKHKLEAPLEQTDARGRRYAFKRWSNGGAASQEITIPETAVDSGVSVIAEYELLSQVTIRSNPPGAAVTVDGVACPTPCKVDRKEGTEAIVEAVAVSDLSDVHRLEFDSWSNAGGRSQTIKVAGAEPATLIANYTTAYKLTMAGDPPDGVRFRVAPSNADNYFTADSTVTVTAEERPGYKFRRWEIDASGTSRTVTISMAKPRTLLARMDKSQTLPIAAIRNAAGVTPEEVVAPGSLISIFGDNLAGYYESGPTGPILAQQLAGVAVTVSNRILPLLFVSPTQINAQLPRDLAPGDYDLHVIRVGQQDSVGTFKVVVRAPGLFNQTVDDQPFAVARHEDGSVVTVDSPARAGEIITLLGTGFGPYVLPSTEGLALPPGPGFNVSTNVALQIAELQPEILFAGGVAGQAGVDQVRFRMPDALPETTQNVFRIRVRMDGRNSNEVVLPVAR